MQRSICGHVWLGTFVVALMLATVSPVHAQSVVDGRRAEFSPSAEHNSVDPVTGAPIVESYMLQIFVAADSTPVQTVNLGKPSPDVDGMIRLDYVSMLSTPLTPGVIYEAQVTAMGPGGSAASERSNTFAFSVTCSPTISPSSSNVAATGFNGTAAVSAGSGCAWTATSSVSWITITAGASGTGSASVSYTVAANAGSVPRSGILTIGGNSFTVTQAGTPCVATISPLSANAAAGTFSGNVPVTVASGCTWTASSNVSWITVTGGATGTGSGSVSYSGLANPLSTSRTGTLTIGGNTFTLTQAGTPCAATISSTSANVASAAFTGSVPVTVGTGCNWTASSSASWITIASGATGTGNGSVSYSGTANLSGTPRSGLLTIGGNTFTVTQAGVACTPTLSATAASGGATAFTGSVNVTSATGCAWTSSSNAAWITITAGASGSGNGSVSYSVAANAGSTSRTGTATIAGTTFTVTQAGTPCAPTISSTAASVGSAPSAGTVSVTASTGCTWTAASSAAWITVTAGASGSGNGSVNYSIATNTGGTSRTGTLTIAGQTFTVTQAGAACTPTLSATTANGGATTFTGTVAVTAATGCAWTAASNDAWITVPAGAAGNGNGSVTYSAAINTGSTSRTGTLTIGGNTFTLTQAGAPCAPAISANSASVPSSTFTGAVPVTAASGCSWTAASGSSWITVTGGATGSGNGSVSYSGSDNPSSAPRSGTLTIAGNSFTITQSGASCAPSLSSSTASGSAASFGGTIGVYSAIGCDWTAMSNAAWITVTAGASGSGAGSVNYVAAANVGGSPRTGTMTIGGSTFTVTQAAAPCVPTISTNGANLGATGFTGVVPVSVGPDCSWTAVSNASWITVSGGASGTGNGSVTYVVSPNAGTTPRTGTMTIGGNTFTINQAGTACSASISPITASIGAGAFTGSIPVTAGAGCAWAAASNASWLTITAGSSGSGSGSVSYVAATNTTSVARTGTLTVAGQTFTVFQAAPSCVASLSTSGASAAATSSTGFVTVTMTAGCGWTATSSAPWITITAGATGSGSGSVSYVVAANTGSAPRVGTLTIAGNTFTVTQAGTSCTYTLTATNQSLGANGGSGSLGVNTAVGCTWSATSDSSWVTVSSGTGRSGYGTIGYTAAANTTGAARSATLSIAGTTFVITEPSNTCTFTVSSALLIIPPGGTTNSVTVTTQPSCAWTTSTTAPWVTMTPSGVGTGTVTFTIGPNTGTLSRSASISVAGVVLTMIQNQQQ